MVFEKGVSDTLQYRRRSKDSPVSLRQMFGGISLVLEQEYGRYLYVSPRRNVSLLKLDQWKWTVKRMQVKSRREGFAHIKSAKRGADTETTPFVYLHVCC